MTESGDEEQSEEGGGEGVDLQGFFPAGARRAEMVGLVYEAGIEDGYVEARVGPVELELINEKLMEHDFALMGMMARVYLAREEEWEVSSEEDEDEEMR